MELRTVEKIKSKINGVTSPNNKVRAAFYGRVSTKNDSQADSCDNQLFLAHSFIAKHPNIELLEKNTLIEQGISGKNVIDRPKFNKLLSLVRTEKIDLIMAKSMSRLHRDEETAIILKQLCIQHNVVIVTLEDQKFIDFEDEKDAFLQSIINIIDAQYVSRQSEYGKTVQATRCEQKLLASKDVCFGYDWNEKVGKTPGYITVNEEAKSIITQIFELYVFEQRNPTDIARILNEQGVIIPFSKTKIISAKSVGRIIQNEKYIGHFYINQRTSKLLRGAKGKSQRINLPREEWILVERPDLQIIDSEIFELAQRLREAKQTEYNHVDKTFTRSNFEGKHDFAGLIKCKECGMNYQFDYADRAHTKPIYRVKHKGCCNNNSRLTESAVKDIVIKSIKTMLYEQTEAIERVEKALYNCLYDNDNNEEKAQINNEITKLEQKLDNYAIAYCTAITSGNTVLQNRINKMCTNTQERIDSLIEKRKQYEIAYDEATIKKQIKQLQIGIDSFKNLSSLSRERILRNIREIIVSADGGLDVVLTPGPLLRYDVGKIGRLDAPYSSLVINQLLLPRELHRQ